VTPDKVAFFLEAVVSMLHLSGTEAIGRNVSPQCFYYRLSDPEVGEFAIWLRGDSVGITGPAPEWWQELARSVSEKFDIPMHSDMGVPIEIPIMTHLGAVQL